MKRARDSPEQPSTKRVTLVLGEGRFPVDKHRLIERSRYFQSLYSHDFSDSHADEHTVNYKLPASVLQDFCDWIEEDNPQLRPDESHQIKISLQKFLSDSFDCLKQLLELSIIYSVEELSSELSDILIQHWLKPELLLDIWRLSRELSLKSLTDITYSACLERFMEIPVDDLLNISSPDFLQLVRNVNIRSSIDYLSYIVNEKLKKEDSSPEKNNESQLKVQLIKFIGMLKNPERKPSLMDCFFTEAIKTENNFEYNARIVYAFQQRVPAKFGELIEVWRTEEPGKDLAGVGVIGRGFSIYKIGGEMRLGSCKFNMNVWRYCLISKKWYYLSRLRKARRHMAMAVVDDKLILIGGVGRYRLKLSSVEMLNLNTGSWTNSPGTPETFTDVPPTCVINGIVVLCVSNIYMFNPTLNSWITVEHEYDSTEFRGVKCMISHENTIYLGREGGKYVGYEVTWGLDDAQMVVCGARISRSEDKLFRSPCEKLLMDENARVIGMIYAFEKVTVECGVFNKPAQRLDSRLHNFVLPNLVSLISVACFNVVDPTTLYKEILPAG